jgi:hypothetical protein
VTLPLVSVRLSLAAGTLLTFGWLLAQDRIHPIVIYCLQLYLTF